MATMSLSPSGLGPAPTLPSPCETQVATVSSPVWCRAPLCSSGLAAQTLGRISLHLLYPTCHGKRCEQNHGNVRHLSLLAWLGSLGQQRAIWRGVT